MVNPKFKIHRDGPSGPPHEEETSGMPVNQTHNMPIGQAYTHHTSQPMAFPNYTPPMSYYQGYDGNQEDQVNYPDAHNLNSIFEPRPQQPQHFVYHGPPQPQLYNPYAQQFQQQQQVFPGPPPAHHPQQVHPGLPFAQQQQHVRPGGQQVQQPAYVHPGAQQVQQPPHVRPGAQQAQRPQHVHTGFHRPLPPQPQQQPEASRRSVFLGGFTSLEDMVKPFPGLMNRLNAHISKMSLNYSFVAPNPQTPQAFNAARFRTPDNQPEQIRPSPPRRLSFDQEDPMGIGSSASHEQASADVPRKTPKDLFLEALAQRGIEKVKLPGFPETPSAKPVRATNFVVATDLLKQFYPEVHSHDILILFDSASQVAKINRDVLFNQSTFFRKALSEPQLDVQTLCIRLRDDFPPVISSLVSFMGIGSYALTPAIKEKHPHITMLDMHVHAYAFGAKYDIPVMRCHAIAQYIEIAARILSLNFLDAAADLPRSGASSSSSSTTVTPDVFRRHKRSGMPNPYNEAPKNPTSHRTAHVPIKIEPHNPNDISARAELDRLLDSLCLLYKITDVRPAHDDMRQAVIGLLKPRFLDLMKVAFFVRLITDLKGFGIELMKGLSDDGYDVMLVPDSLLGGRSKDAVRFDKWD